MGDLGDDFDAFVVARSPALLRTAVLLCAGDRHAAEDLLQQALLRLARHWKRELASPDAYVRRSLVNLARDRHRRFSRRPRETSWPEHLPAEPVTVGLTPYDDLVAALAELPARQRATLVLRFWDDLSVADTAAALGCSPGTVKSNTNRGLSRLRTILEGDRCADRG